MTLVTFLNKVAALAGPSALFAKSAPRTIAQYGEELTDEQRTVLLTGDPTQVSNMIITEGGGITSVNAVWIFKQKSLNMVGGA